MKKAGFLFLIVSVLCFVVGCSNGNHQDLVDEKFMFSSLPWGETWEELKENPQLASGKVIADDENRVAIELENFEFLGVSGTAVLLFSVSEPSFPATGLTNIYFAYDDAEEETLIAEGEKRYGERKSFFLDENGIENPLNPPAWYSEETIEGSLTDSEKETYSNMLAGMEQTRKDAIMRGPLVIISVEEENNMVRLLGSAAATVKNIKELEK